MEPEKFKAHRAKRKTTTLVIRRKTILSQFLPISEEGSLHFWRASQLSLPLHSVRTSAVNGQVTLQTLWVFYFPLHWLSLLHFSYWDFSTSSQFSLFGQNITVSSDCWARWPGQLFMPASCNFCHWWTSLPHPSSVFTSPVSLIFWLEFSLSQWLVWFFPIWYSVFSFLQTEIGK